MSEWVQLRKDGHLWGEYNPRTNEIRFVRGSRRAHFKLADLGHKAGKSQAPEPPASPPPSPQR